MRQNTGFSTRANTGAEFCEIQSIEQQQLVGALTSIPYMKITLDFRTNCKRLQSSTPFHKIQDCVNLQRAELCGTVWERPFENSVLEPMSDMVKWD